MNMKWLIVGAVVVVSAAVAWLDRQHGVEVQADKESADSYAMLPNAVALPNLLNDEAVRLDGFSGRYLLLNFWASWCVPCLAEFPRLLTLAQEHSAMLSVVAVSVDEEKAAAVTFIDALKGRSDAPALQEHVYYAWDEGKRISIDRFQTYRYPETIIVDPKGRMVRKFAGELSEQDLKQIRSLLH